MSDDQVHYYTEPTMDGQGVSVTITETSDTREKFIYASDVKVIPIVYIHGMLSSALKAKGQKDVEDGANVWTAPSGILASLGSLLSSLEFAGYTAAEHQIKLDPNTTEIDYDADAPWWYDNIDKKTANLRGWNSVWKAKEQSYLDKLQGVLNNLKKVDIDQMKSNSALEKYWYALVETDPAQYGGVSNQAKEQITRDELKTMQKYQFDIWVSGYNWLDDHENQAKNTTLPRIRDYILGHYKKENYSDPPEKVIILTHSLGGIASRTFTQLANGEDLVWGVSHSCQPAEGAPTAYHHVRCGYNGAAAPVLGQGTNYVTPLLANGLGVMSLLPFPAYQNGAPWLFIQQKNADGSHSVVSLPRNEDASDLFDSIYKSRAWYGLLPSGRNDQRILNPAGLEFRVDTYDKFCKQLDKAEKFQAKLNAAGYHKMTFAHAESQVHKKTKTWAHGQWEVIPPSVYGSDFTSTMQATIKVDGYDTQSGVPSNEQISVSRRDRGKLILTNDSRAEYLPPDQDKNWIDPYGSVKHHNLSGAEATDINRTADLVSDYTSLRCSGDETVAAASGEAPYIRSIAGGYFLHGQAPVYKKLYDDYLQLKTKIKEDSLIPSFESTKYGHSAALGDDLPFYSNLHAIIKIVAGVVDKEWK